ncbi:hypothetical protein ACQEVB_08860 [Pseudonocardia sp. CA-107938]|uniref:hypothetical protein n=1 Tax=Pseudonocardia sp. CA-107938 TaxID=3240021 RepID=UPI003D8E3ECE
MHRRALLSLLIAPAVLLAGACSTTVSGTAQPSAGVPASAQDITYQNGFREFVDTMATMRTWDPCAMHDVAGAESATGGKRQYIVPTSTVNKCQLVLTHAGDDHTWSIDVATTFEGYLTRTYDAGDLNGTKVYRQKAPEDPNTPSFGVSCAYFFPVQEPLGIKVDVQTTAKETRDRMCSVADAYMTALLPKLKNPPLVSAGLTTPTISEYGKDPCLALKPALQARPKDRGGNPNYVSGMNPYTCDMTSDPGIDKITFQFTTLFDEGGKTVTLGGHKAFVKDRMGECDYRIPVDPPIKFKVDDPKWPGYEPGMQLTMDGKCDDALATAVVAAADAQPKATARPDAAAVPLGKLVP